MVYPSANSTNVECSTKPGEPYVPCKQNPRNKDVVSALIGVGLSPYYVGFNYIRQAVLLAVDDVKILSAITKTMYPKLARMNSVNTGIIERCIRSCIDKMECDDATKISYLGIAKERYTNKEFIALMAELIRCK